VSDGRFVRIKIDKPSWPVSAGGVPPELDALDGARRKMSILSALLHTALRTSPPTSTGLDLADYWAWLRYGPAIDDTAGLTLRGEWKDIDPHQKNILSDDLGMGFTTYLLSRVLKFKSFADTLHFANVAHPGLYFFLKEKKNGKYKSPDFVAMDGAGDPKNISVVECKGTQSSMSALKGLMKSGVEQKKNLFPVAGSGGSIKHRLVAGLLIPASDKTFEATIRLSDPEFREFNNALAEIPPERLETAVVQVDLAKHFALMSLRSISRALATTNAKEQNRLSGVDRGELRNLQRISSDGGHTFSFEYPLPDRARCVGRHVRRARFTITSPDGLYETLLDSQALEGTLAWVTGMAKEGEWVEATKETAATLITPLGFRLTLEYLLQ
jgi:hypothetical protein